MKEKRFGGSFVGNVKEILDANLISIDLKNTRIVKGMILNGHRIWVYNKGEETLNQYISDKEDVINYYKNNPDELEELRTKEDWRPRHWYQAEINIDDCIHVKKTKTIQDDEFKSSKAVEKLIVKLLTILILF